MRSDDPYISGVRVGQNQPRVVRLVLDLKQPVEPQMFPLDPVAAYQYRLVFDLYPVQAQDPLLALLHGKEQAERAAAQSVQDALGEFIGRIPGTPGSASAPQVGGPPVDVATSIVPNGASAPRAAEAASAALRSEGVAAAAMEPQAPFVARPLTPEEIGRAHV